MYTDMGLLFPHTQKSSQEARHFADLFQSHLPNASVIHLIETSTIAEYDLGGEGDLFKAPEPIIEEPVIDLDPMTAPVSMKQIFQNSPIQSDQLLSEVFYDCQKDLLEKSAIERPVFKILDSNITNTSSDGKHMAREKFLTEEPFQKSDSSGCLSSMEWINRAATRANFLDFTGMDFETADGMRRAFSEGDMKALGNGGISPGHNPRERHNCSNEERMQKLSRYWNKKKKRNFGRKIKYACRKALADSQPRVRGRFARTEELDIPKKN